MKKKDILSFGIYLIITLIYLFYFFNRASAYEYINSIEYFIAYPVSLFLALCFLIYRLILTDRKEYIFQLIITITLILIAMSVVFEFVKPNYTYAEARKRIEGEYKVATIDSEEKILINESSNKEIYKITTLENSQEIGFSFNPYSKETFKIE